MIFIEINEFSPELMGQAAVLINGRNLKRLLALAHTRTRAIEEKERFGLDPWVQWVSIHTGMPASLHRVSHLGDVPQLEHKQIWETLGERGVTCGIWGAMNASRGSGVNTLFFFPDPWTFSEDAFPTELNSLLGLPRYYSRNYGDLSVREMAKQFSKLIAFCLRPRVLAAIGPLLPTLLRHVARYGFSEYLLFVMFDLVNTKLYVHYCRRFKPNFSLLFLNSLAHLQHHKWKERQGLSQEMEIAFRLFDRLLGIIFVLADESGSPLLFANAFSQRRSFDDMEFLYRQKNPQKFLNTLGVRYSRIEQAMTNDGHVFFDSQEDLNRAIEILESVRIGGQSAFHLDLTNRLDNRFFFQFVIWRQIGPDETLDLGDRQFRFFSLFDEITRRSGIHLQEGDAFASDVELPPELINFQLHHQIMKFFDTRTAGAVSG